MTDDLAAVLHREHLQTLEAINALEARLFGADGDRPVDITIAEDRQLLQTLIRVVDHDITCHFQFEEAELFPLLTAAGIGDIVDMLVQEHEAVRPIALQLRELAEQALGSGFTDDRWSEFRDTAMDLMHSVMFHIQKEEMGVIRRLGFLLDAETTRRLGRAYAATAAG
jgi:hemerythrin-like domain-containing protein